MKNAKVKRLFSVVLLCFFLFSDLSAAAWACSSLIVGKDASASGYAMFSRTEDSISTSAKSFFVYPAGYYKKGHTIVDPTYGWAWTWTKDSYRMTATPDMPINTTNIYDQAGVNEHGFMMTTTNTTTNRTQNGDPMVRPGFGESLMQTVLLGECKDSDEALTMWGNIVENDGMAENCFWMLNDAGGNHWVTDNCGGHRWVAARVPDDAFMVMANDMNIDYVDLNDTKNFRGSKDLITHAISSGFAIYGPPGTPEADKVNIALTYGTINAAGNTYRRWMAFNLFAPSLNLTPKAPFNSSDASTYTYPMFAKPDRKISALDVMNFQRSRYQGTPYDLSESPMYFGTAVLPQRLGRYIHMLSESENATLPDPAGSGTVSARLVGHITQKEAHIYEQIPELPPEIGARWWFIEGQPEFSLNLPFYGNINDTHPAYKKLTVSHAFDPESAFWIFREVSYLGRANRKQYGKPIQAYWQEYEKKLYAEQDAITKELIERYKKDPKDAAEWITDYTIATAQAGMNRAGLIRNALVKHMATNSGDLFVVPSDSTPFVNATFDIHPTSGDALLTLNDTIDVASTLGISEWTIRPAYLKLPSPYPLQHFTPQLYTVEDLNSGHPTSLGDDATVLQIPGVRIYADLESSDLSAGNLIKVRYTAEIMDSAYKVFENSVEKVKKGFSLHAMLPGYSNGFELVGPNGVVSLPDAIKTGKAWVFGGKDRASVMIDFYLYDDAGSPAFGNGGKIVVPDGKADSVLNSGAMWAAAYQIDDEEEPDDPCKDNGCSVFPIGYLLGFALIFEVLFRKKSK
jgi:dipeptidase